MRGEKHRAGRETETLPKLVGRRAIEISPTASNDRDLPWIGAGVSVKCKFNPLSVFRFLG